MKNKLSYGQRIADRIAAFGGSWTFIFLFFGILMGWIVLNAWILNQSAYDPYPFILLNLILSCLAAIQAPIIMMSQNRQEEKDRIHAENDYLINQKAEKEIRGLHQKVDELREQIQALISNSQKTS
ncbi:MAG: DUF1003 domain-containing protein [Sphingomonadales bacterium]|nr:DUF1003 domain-containing protein [Sphingomonadales bacterium]